MLNELLHRRPRIGFETDHKSIPNELGVFITAVHMKRGCYRGQETVAKIYNLGNPPRRLVMLHLDGSDAGFPASWNQELKMMALLLVLSAPLLATMN